LARLGIAVLWLLGRLRPSLRRRVCEGLALVFMWFAHERRAVVRTNLRLCFPNLSDAAREALAREHFHALGHALALDCTVWFGSASDVRRAVRVEGLGHFAAAADRPRILFAPHFVGLDAAAARLSLEHPAVAMYSTQKDPAFDRFLIARRTRFGDVRMIPRTREIKPALRGLREGLPLFFQPDMDFGPRESVFVPFFGVPAATVPALSRIARLTGAAVLTVIAELARGDEQHGGAECIVQIAPLPGLPGSSVEADTRRMNPVIEEFVRRMPEQYYWIHKRFKTRPPGEPPVYA
jgi:KDO2-lipid IV(A) lauroyltransferase